MPVIEAMATHGNGRKLLAASPITMDRFTAFSPYHVGADRQGGMVDVVPLAHPDTEGDGEPAVKIADLTIHATPAIHTEAPGRTRTAIGFTYTTDAAQIWYTSDTNLSADLLRAVADILSDPTTVIAHADAAWPWLVYTGTLQNCSRDQSAAETPARPRTQSCAGAVIAHDWVICTAADLARHRRPTPPACQLLAIPHRPVGPARVAHHSETRPARPETVEAPGPVTSEKIPAAELADRFSAQHATAAGESEEPEARCCIRTAAVFTRLAKTREVK